MTVKLGYKDIQDLEDLHRNSGRHFFDADAMRFFDSRIHWQVYPGSEGWYFVTSEQFHNRDYSAPREYNVRIMHPDGSIDLVDAFLTRRQAHKAAEKLAQGEN